MGRFRVSELALGFLLGFAALLVIFILSSNITLHEISAAFDSHNGLITAVATIFIAWFTLSLRQSTDKLWDAGERQLKLLAETSAAQSRDMQASIAAARDAAEASQKSANASLKASETSDEIFKKFEVPYLYPVDLKYSTSATGPVISISFRNYGRYPATLGEAWIILAVTRPENPSNTLFKTDRIPFMVEGMIGDKETCDPIIFKAQDIWRYASQIASGAVNLNLLIQVGWEDAMDHQRGTSRWFVWNRTREKFVSGVQLWTEN
jgi:hypothetical protein